MESDTSDAANQYLAEQLTAIERCAYFALMTSERILWPVKTDSVQQHCLDAQWFEPLAALNERFAKLQDLLGSTMRHVALLLAEPAPAFLHVLVYFEKNAVIASTSNWMRIRKMRNDAAHDYDLDPHATAEHFNQLAADLPELIATTQRLVLFCREMLSVSPVDDECHLALNCKLLGQSQ